MSQKLIIEHDYSLDELKSKIDGGARFVIFQYCISLFFAVTLRRISPAILIENDDDIPKYRRKYNIYSYIFGWWGIPWGPIQTVKSLNINKKGGLDVTEDILLNLTEEGLKNREIEIEKTNQIFAEPDKYNDHSFKKVAKSLKEDKDIERIVIGLFINTEDGVRPYHIVGLRSGNYEQSEEILRKKIKKKFRPGTYFEYVNLNETSEINSLLEKQGVVYK